MRIGLSKITPKKRHSTFAALLILAIAASSLPAQDREYFVNGRKVAEPVYRAATMTNEALWLIEADRLGEAKEKLLDALRLAPDFFVARYDLGLVSMRLGDDDAAAAEFTAVIAAGAEVPEAWVSLAGLQCNRRRCDDALTLLDDAARRFPAATWERVPEYYFNRGAALAKTGRTAEAIDEFKRALRADPNRASTWLNLAALYQEAGRLEESLAHYREFLRRAPEDPDAPVVSHSIQNIESELRQAKLRPPSEANAGDYFFEATQGRAKVWSSRSMPVRVFIHPGEGVTGFEPRYTEILKAAFDEWSRAAEGRVRFRFTDKIREADIECLWTSDPNQLKNPAEGGETRVSFRENEGLYDAQIFILTVPISRSVPVTDRSIRFIALHEVGHALGMLGHSGDPDDIMYFSIPVSEKERELSARDKKTLLRLYGRK